MNAVAVRTSLLEAIGNISSCPVCEAALGAAWGRKQAAVAVDHPRDPDVTCEALKIEGACGACRTALVEIVVSFVHKRRPNYPDQRPCQSRVSHPAGLTWVMSKFARGGREVVDHWFGPFPDDQYPDAIDGILEILDDLPRPYDFYDL